MIKQKLSNLFFVIKNYFQNNKVLASLLLVFIITASSASVYLVQNHRTNTQNNNTEKIYSISLPEANSPDKSEQSAEPTEDSQNQNTTSSEPPSSSVNSSTETATADSPPSTSSSSDSDSSDSTPPPTPESPSATVVFYGDTQSDTDQDVLNHQRVVGYILATSGNPVFHAGDVMEDGTQDSMDKFITAASPLLSARTFYAALGNNDRNSGGGASTIFLNYFNFPGNEHWYSLNVGNLHMIILDSAFSASDPAQLAWLEADLKTAASQSRITGVMFHHPTFTPTVINYLAENHADFIVAGHIHSYTHAIVNGVHQFTTTGQSNIGYFLVKVYSDKAVFYVRNSSNTLVTTITVNDR